MAQREHLSARVHPGHAGLGLAPSLCQPDKRRALWVNRLISMTASFFPSQRLMTAGLSLECAA